jgi:HAD superfamily hydrolase (TIGR01509 family)
MAADPGNHFDGVVFDLDGVLVESEHLWEENWTQHAAANDYTWLATDTATVQGMSVPEWSGYMAERIGRGRPEEIAEAVIDGMIGALHGGRVDLLPGAPQMVAVAADRVPIAVASSAPRRLIAAVLEATGLAPHFSAFVSSEEVPRGKPSPDVYLEAARQISVPAASCAAVEDSSNGIRAAVAAGMTVIAIPNSVYPPRPDALALCAKIAPSPEEVRRFLIERLPEPKSIAEPTPGGIESGAVRSSSR